jgi:hypothetical protein
VLVLRAYTIFSLSILTNTTYTPQKRRIREAGLRERKVYLVLFEKKMRFVREATTTTISCCWYLSRSQTFSSNILKPLQEESLSPSC